MNEVVNQVTNTLVIPDLILAGGTIIAIGVSILALVLTQRGKRIESFLSLWKEYSTHEMLDSLLVLYKLWNDYGGDEKKIVEAYEKKFRSGDFTLHNHRRRVSLLFQQLAFMYHNRLIPRKFRKKWLGFSIEVIAILYHIEIKALPNLWKNQPEFPDELDLTEIDSKDFRRMFTLYNIMKKRGKPPSDFEKWIRALSQSIP